MKQRQLAKGDRDFAKGLKGEVQKTDDIEAQILEEMDNEPQQKKIKKKAPDLDI